MRETIGFILGVVLFILATWFVQLEFVPFEWSKLARFLWLIFAIISGILGYLLLFFFEIKK
jgi:heme/copper-type cytochrome/quinol oxidase subunit 4